VLRDPNGPANDPPFAGDDFGYTTINAPVNGNFISNDSDPNANPVSIGATTIVPGGAHTPIGAPVATAMGGTVQFYADGTYTYNPPSGYVGPDNINYTICDVTAVAPQPLCNIAQIHLLVGPGISIAGKVWDDANGNIAIDGSENGTNVSSALYVNLVNNIGNVVATIPVAADGSYNFNNVTPGQNYSLVLSTTQGTIGQPAPLPVLPANWVNTGESRNGTTDGGIPGVIDLRNYGFTNTVNYNFGIEQLPNSNSVTQSIPQPVIGQIITLNGSGSNPPVPVGSDPEDGSLGATNTVVITAIPLNSNLLYNSVLVSNGQTIPNFNPSLLQVQITAATVGSLSTAFQFAYVDAAGKQDPTPAIYTLQWSSPLPVVLVSFTGKANLCDAILQWVTSQEINSDKFVIEQSTDGTGFAMAAEVKATNKPAGSAYQVSISQAAGNSYYRLKIIDKDGSFKYSSIISIRSNCDGRDYLVAYPNPVKNQLTVSFFTSYRGNAVVEIANAIGQQLERRKVSVTTASNVISLDMNRYVQGVYTVRLINEKGESLGNVQKIVKD
jgi:hypothetical protein